MYHLLANDNAPDTIAPYLLQEYRRENNTRPDLSTKTVYHLLPVDNHPPHPVHVRRLLQKEQKAHHIFHTPVQAVAMVKFPFAPVHDKWFRPA